MGPRLTTIASWTLDEGSSRQFFIGGFRDSKSFDKASLGGTFNNMSHPISRLSIFKNQKIWHPSRSSHFLSFPSSLSAKMGSFVTAKNYWAMRYGGALLIILAVWFQNIILYIIGCVGRVKFAGQFPQIFFIPFKILNQLLFPGSCLTAWTPHNWLL